MNDEQRRLFREMSALGRPQCWGCECEVELDQYGYHREPTDVPGKVYVYPCTAVQQSEWSNAT